MYKNAWCRCRVVVLPIQPVSFSTFSLSSPSWHFILPNVLLSWPEKNSRHLAKSPLVFPPNDVWGTSAEIPYWWRVTTQIWVVLLIGRAAWEFASINQKHYPDLGIDSSSVWDSCSRPSDITSWRNQWWRPARNVSCFLGSLVLRISLIFYSVFSHV